jgi:hypothetical protein
LLLHPGKSATIESPPPAGTSNSSLMRPFLAGLIPVIGESSNGRTADSDSVNLGSNPSSPAKTRQKHLIAQRNSVVEYMPGACWSIAVGQ